MTALDGWIDVCRTGNWRDVRGHDVRIDEGRLDAIVASLRDADPAPVVVGHPETDAPAFAWVESLRRVGDRLQAKLRDVAPEFREAVEAGRYAKRSIALRGNQLRHLGFLGAAAPAVDGLTPTQFAKTDEGVLEVVEFAAEGYGVIARVFRRLKNALIAEKGEEAADRIVSDFEIDMLNEMGREEERDAPSLASRLGSRLMVLMEENEVSPARLARAMGIKPGTLGDILDGKIMRPPDRRIAAAAKLLGVRAKSLMDLIPQSSLAGAPDGAVEDEVETLAAEHRKVEEERRQLDAERAELSARMKKLEDAEKLRAAEDAVEPHVREGRVLPAEKPALAALLAALKEAEEVALASPEGEEAKRAPAEILTDLLAAIPPRVDFREHAEAPLAADEEKDVSARAKAYMARCAEGGVVISAAEAVDAVRAGKDEGGGK